MSVLAAVALAACRGDAGPSVIASFNIEHFPRHERQVKGAIDELAATGASVIALQEITDPARLVDAARRHLAGSWEFVHDAPRVARHHHIGVLFDRARWRLVRSTSHDDTRLEPRDLPVLEVQLARERGPDLMVFVVHLRPLATGRSARARQHAALARIVAARRVQASGHDIAVLGDFNATAPEDRDDLAALARTAQLHWASEPLACTAFWKRDDGCARSRLDHVLVSWAPQTVRAAGGCAAAGCAHTDRCPRYVEEVSDHCPVIVTRD